MDKFKKEEPRMAEKQVWKEIIHSGDKCMVSIYEEHCRYSDGNDPGGYSVTHYTVTDETSEKAYETLTKVLANITPPPSSCDDEPVNINKRASRAVDVA